MALGTAAVIGSRNQVQTHHKKELYESGIALITGITLVIWGAGGLAA